jgi:hypothetical protein
MLHRSVLSDGMRRSSTAANPSYNKCSVMIVMKMTCRGCCARSVYLATPLRIPKPSHPEEAGGGRPVVHPSTYAVINFVHYFMY